MSGHRHRPHHVVILGGGITGLSAAFHLARKHPAVQITLVEKSDRFGGWMRSERVQVRDSDGNRGSVLLEAGPRTIRPNSKSILELVRHLRPRPTTPLNIVFSFSWIDTPLGLAFRSPLYAPRLTRRPQPVLAHRSHAGATASTI